MNKRQKYERAQAKRKAPKEVLAAILDLSVRHQQRYQERKLERTYSPAPAKARYNPVTLRNVAPKALAAKAMHAGSTESFTARPGQPRLMDGQMRREANMKVYGTPYAPRT